MVGKKAQQSSLCLPLAASSGIPPRHGPAPASARLRRALLLAREPRTVARRGQLGVVLRTWRGGERAPMRGASEAFGG